MDFVDVTFGLNTNEAISHNNSIITIITRAFSIIKYQSGLFILHSLFH